MQLQQAKSKYFVLTADFLIPLLLIVLAIAGYVAAFHTQLFALTNITCQLDYQPCDNPSVLAELDNYRGQNLLNFDQEYLRNRLLSGDFTIRELELTRELPSTLKVDLLSTYPVVALQSRDDQLHWISLDERFRVIGVRETDPNVPTLTISSVPPFQLGGTFADPLINSTLELALDLTSEISSVKTIELTSDSTITLTLDNGVEVLFTTEHDQQAQLLTLQSLLQNEEIISTYHTIDVRYSQPVLK